MRPSTIRFLFIASFALLSAATTYAANPPVILISIDTLRADHLSAYGYRRALTPNIDSLAGHGTVFRDVSSQIPLTLPSHFSLFTSTYPFTTRVEENAEQVPPTAVTLPSVLQSRGYRTAAFIGAIYLERELGFDRGFDFYDSPFRFEAFSSLSGSMFYGDRNTDPLHARDRRDGSLVIRAALQWLNANRNQPVFAFVHLFDLHQPYRLAPSDTAHDAISQYDAALNYVDRLIGSFREALIRDGWWDRSLVILFSDHGESLGDHGEQTHGYFIYQSTVQVPLIMHWPTTTDRPPAPDQLAALTDVAPTILDFLHIPTPPSFVGRSLLQPSPDQNRAPAVYSESVYTHDAFGWSPLRSVRVGRYKYIGAPHPELYDLDADPRELRNLMAREPAVARSLQSRLAQLLASHPPERPSSAGVIPADRAIALNSLGMYVAPGPHSNVVSSFPDPKDRLAEYSLYERAQYEILSGRNAGAITILRRILACDPKNTLARRDLGVSYIAEGSYASARSTLQQVLSVAPADFVAHYELGVADEHLGLYSEALDHLDAACRVAPQSAACARELKSVRDHLRPRPN